MAERSKDFNERVVVATTIVGLDKNPLLAFTSSSTQLMMKVKFKLS